MSVTDDVAEIIMLTHRYARAVDRYDPAALLNVFSVDATLDHSPYGYPVRVGHDEIGAHFAESRRSGRQSMHVTSTHIVDLTGPDDAVGSSYVQAFRPAADGGQPLTAALAINEDKYVRTADGWRISHRVTSPMIDITFDF